MTSELRNAVALWSDPSPPNDFCHYDHCFASVPFGTMRIEWKSWKDYPNYCLYFDAGETFIGSFDSLDRAKSHAAAVIEADREAVRAEQAAEVAKWRDKYNELGQMTLEQVSDLGTKLGRTETELGAAKADLQGANRELAKFKALAETLAEALGEIEKAPAWGYPDKWETTPAQVRILARQALTSYKEQRDAS